ncbi:DUF5304 family protein [Streptomyces huiliensis]|uniref:DUF5304 family protein n=1 Tax=Streptomyces huiliensis TaxID=2876027 RepID=UPI001CBB9899|nr:DUF5304 family protein [Streptomyces huiliensis]MBZ4318762.1 DUF5304 domain-containing protein [Streptomyces huiliensis]
MNDANERPASPAGPDPDAWEAACAEDLAEERARRRAEQGQEPGSAADELRRLVEAVADKVASFQLPLAGAVAQGAVQQVVERAKAVVEPVIERNPDVFDHLASAGSELMAAYRAAVRGQEQRWTRAAAEDRPAEERPAGGRDGDGGEGTGGTERIDLD